MNLEKRSFQFIPDNEKKVIYCGAMIYTVKGFIIYPTSEEERLFPEDTFRTLPVVDDGYEVIDDENLNDGIKYHIIGREGDTIPLGELSECLRYNAFHMVCDLSDILEDVQKHHITVTNSHPRFPEQRLPDMITVNIDGGICGEQHYRIDSDYPDSYLLPQRFSYVGEDGRLYMNYQDVNRNRCQSDNDTITQQIADDIESYMWFFNNPALRLHVRSYRTVDSIEDGVPDTWPQCLQSLESDVNRLVEVMAQEYIEAHEKL